MFLLWMNMYKWLFEFLKVVYRIWFEIKFVIFIRFNKIGVLCFEILIKLIEMFMYLYCSSVCLNVIFRGIIKVEIIWYKNIFGL